MTLRTVFALAVVFLMSQIARADEPDNDAIARAYLAFREPLHRAGGGQFELGIRPAARILYQRETVG